MVKNLVNFNRIAFLLIILGALNVFASITGLKSVQHAAKAWLFSPAPRPFSRPLSSRSVSHVRFLFSDGSESKYSKLQVLRQLKGPHRREIPYIMAFLQMEHRSREFARPILRYLLCELDDVANLFERKEVSSFALIYRDKTEGNAVSCTSKI